MNTDTTTEVEPSSGERLAKLLAATAVGFIATKLTENALDKLFESRRNKTTSE